jgi:mannose-6-phosphate isomerase-like protein (cupin superfamily)
MAIKSLLEQVTPYQTKDGSRIFELMQPAVHGNAAQSLARAEVDPGRETLLHRHRITEELYHVLAGRGLLTLGDERFEVGPGDTVCMPPGTPHKIANITQDALVFLCCCTPAYRHEDTEVLEEE